MPIAEKRYGLNFYFDDEVYKEQLNIFSIVLNRISMNKRVKRYIIIAFNISVSLSFSSLIYLIIDGSNKL